MVIATSVCTVAAASPPFVLGVLALQLRRDFEFTAAHLSLGIACYFLFSALLSPLAGWLIRRLGPPGCLVLSTALASAAMVCLALSSTWQLAVLAQLIAGAGNSVVQPAVSHVISEAVSFRFRGLALGFNQSAVPMSTLIAAALVPSLALTLGWRWCAWGLAAGFALAVALIPRDRMNRAAADSAVRTPTDGVGGPRPAVSVLVTFALAGMCASMAATNLPAFFTISAVGSGMSETGAAMLQVAGSVLCIAVRVASGWLGDGRRPDYLTPVAIMLLGGALGYACLAAGSSALIAVGALLAFGMGWGWSGLFNLSILLRFPRHVAQVTVATQAGVYLGAMIGPALFGVLLQARDLTAAWSATTACAVIAATLALAARATRPGARRVGPGISLPSRA